MEINNGIIFQFGLVNFNTESVVVTLSIAFANRICSVTATDGGVGCWAVGAWHANLSQITIYHSGADNTTGHWGVFWFAADY